MAKYTKSPKKTFKKKYSYKKKTIVSNNIKSYVHRAINRSQETKMVSISLPPTAFNSAISSFNETYAVIPALSIGPGQTGRIGESVEPQKIVIRGYINYRSNGNQGAQQIISRLFCFQDRAIKQYDLRPQLNMNLLDTGGVGNQFAGTLLNLCAPHNSDHHIFYADRKHTFSKAFGYTNNSGLTTAMTSMNDTLVHFFTITLTKKQLPKSFKYDGSDYPVNFCPFISLGYSFAQDDTPDAVNTQLMMAYTSTLYYKDA